MFQSLTGYLGHQPFNDWFTPDTTQRLPLGVCLPAVDPYWGQGTFIYLKSNDAILKGSCVVWDETHTSVLCPNTANQGFPVAFAMTPAAAGVYFWAQVEGRVVYKTNATVAADAAMGLTAAGILGASSAGKELVGCRNRVAATGIKTFQADTVQNSGELTTTGYDGAFLGMALSGTGIPASTVVAGLGSGGRVIKMGSAIGTFDKVATATGTITLTGTYTGYGSGIVNNPYVQGRIT